MGVFPRNLAGGEGTGAGEGSQHHFLVPVAKHPSRSPGNPGDHGTCCSCFVSGKGKEKRGFGVENLGAYINSAYIHLSFLKETHLQNSWQGCGIFGAEISHLGAKLQLLQPFPCIKWEFQAPAAPPQPGKALGCGHTTQ